MDLPLLDLLLVLLVAVLAGRLAARVGFPSVLGELIAGIVLGPPLLGLLSGNPALDVLAQLGIILMMLYIGMEIDPAEMQKASLGGFLAAIGGFITPFVLCYLLITATGGSPLAGVFVGMAAGVTSLATKSRILSDLRLLDTRIAHVMMAGALIADTLSLIIFAGIIGVAEAGSLQFESLAAAFGKAIAYFVIAGVIGRWGIPAIGARLKDVGRGAAFVWVVLIGLVFAEGAHLAGMHGILGAFVAGLFLRDSVIGRTLRTEVMDLVRDTSVRFLAPIFFVTAGFAVSLDVVTEQPGMLLAVIGVASLGKILGTALFYLPTGHGWREGLVLGASMNGRGAVEIIVAQIGLSMGLITQDIFSILVFMAIATTATVPVFLKLGADWLKRRGELVRTDDERKGTLIVGAGPVARTLASTLDAAVLVDRNTEHVAEARAAGLSAFPGDALDERVLAEAGAAHMRTFIPMTGNPEVDVLAAQVARDTFLIPEVLLPSYAARSAAHAEAARHLGTETLFGSTFDPKDWDYRLEHGLVELDSQEVTTGSGAGELTGALRAAGGALILTLKRDDGAAAFHSGARSETGDTVIYMRPATNPEPTLAETIMKDAAVVDLADPVDLATMLEVASSVLAPMVGERPQDLAAGIAERESVSSTVLERGIAVPHIRLPGKSRIAMVPVRCRAGVTFPGEPDPVHVAFLLASTDDHRREHLRVLAAIARMVSSDNFLADWLAAADGDEIRDLLHARLSALEPTNK